MKELVAEELSGNISSLPDYEPYFGEGDTGELRLYLEHSLYQEEIEQLEQEILNQGVILTESITQDARILVIKFQKAIAPLMIIAIVVGGFAVVIGGLLGWQIFRSVSMGVPLWVWLVGGGALLYLLLRKPVKAAAPIAIQAGKLYLTKKAIK